MGDFIAGAPTVAQTVQTGGDGLKAEAWRHLKGLERMSLCDWPGRVAPVLFLGGCNLRCPTCHNADLAWSPDRLPSIFPADVLRLLSRCRSWYDGLVVSGGEPTCVPGIASFLEDLAALALPVKLDTNGMRPKVVEELLREGLVSVFAVDVKGPYERYPDLTEGVSSDRARLNMERIFGLAEAHPDAFYFRLTKVPSLGEDEIRVARSYLPRGFDLAIQSFKTPPRRMYAQADTEKRRVRGDMVGGPDRPRDSEGLAGQRHQGPDHGHPAGPQGRVQACRG